MSSKKQLNIGLQMLTAYPDADALYESNMNTNVTVAEISGLPYNSMSLDFKNSGIKREKSRKEKN